MERLQSCCKGVMGLPPSLLGSEGSTPRASCSCRRFLEVEMGLIFPVLLAVPQPGAPGSWLWPGWGGAGLALPQHSHTRGRSDLLLGISCGCRKLQDWAAAPELPVATGGCWKLRRVPSLAAGCFQQHREDQCSQHHRVGTWRWV